MDININNEIAYECKHHPNYFITKSGILYSIYVKGGRGKTDIHNPHAVAYGQDKDGYYRVVLSSNGHKTYIKIHTLIVEQFIGDVPMGMCVNHIDGNKHNNNLNNLEIVTNLENIRHAWNTGLINKEHNPKRIQIDVYDNLTGKTDCCTSLEDVKNKYHMTWKYIHCIQNNTVYYLFCYFKKITTGVNQKDYYIECYYNGKLFKTFKDNKDAADYFDKFPNTISSKYRTQHKQEALNRYTLTFPNVSTIENII